MFSRTLFVSIAALAASIPSFGQLITGSITGTVVDTSGASVVGAPVTLTNIGTNVTRSTTTDNTGNYQFLLLPPGEYRIEATHPGFKTVRHDGIVVEAARSMAIPFVLSVGQVSETVEIVAGTPLLEPNSASLGTVMERRKIVDLPLSGRNPMMLANLIPTVRGIGFFGSAPFTTWRGAAVNIGGASSLVSSFLMDGMANDKFVDSGPMTFLSVDATQEFKVITNSMSAEFGRTGGGIVSVISRSGTNQLHGAFYDYLRNTKVNANEFFSNSSGGSREPLVFNQFGGTLGGPVKKNKVFFFLNYEGYRERSSRSRVISSPTAQQRAGDFSDTRTAAGQLIMIYDPLTTGPDPARAGAYIRQPFAGNMIPANRVSLLAREILKLFPSGNLAGLPVTHAQNLYQVSRTPVDKNIWGIKIDNNLSSSRRLSVRYTRDVLDQTLDDYFNNVLTSNDPRGGEARKSVYTPRHSAALQYTHSLTPTLLLDAKSGFNRDYDQGLPMATYLGGFDITTLGFPVSLRNQLPVYERGDKGLFPQFNIGDLLQVGGNVPHGTAAYTWANGASITKIHSAHTVKTGYEYRRYVGNPWSGNVPGFSFDRGFTQGPDPTRAGAAAGYGIASFLLGLPSSGSMTISPRNTKSDNYHAAYVQDDWKATRQLTLNLGMRWEFDSPVTDRYNVLSDFDPYMTSPLQVPGLSLRGGLTYPGVNGVPRELYDRTYRQFAPRLGFAYQPMKKVVIRGAYGINYVPIKSLSYPATGFSVQTQMITSVDGGLTPYASITNPFPNGLSQPTGSRLGALTGLGTNISGQLRNITPGYAQQWNLTLQYEPWTNWLFEAAYVGNRGVHLLNGQAVNLNQLNPAYLRLGNDLLRSVPNPFYGVITTGPLSTPTVTQQQLLLPYPQYTGVTGGSSFTGDSIYHALAAKVEKRFSRGFSVLAAYTKSKLIDAASAGSGAVRPGADTNSSIVNWYNLRAERSRSIEDMPQRLVLTGQWELPFLKGAKGWKRPLAGWQINSVTTIESGRPIALTSATGGRPNVVAGVQPKLDNPTLGKWFNTAAFSVPAPFTFGNASRTIPNVSSDGMFSMDFSILKNFPLQERFNLQLRAEAFNLTNTPTFDVPVTNVASTTFGAITATAFAPKPRQIQLALRLTF